MVDRNVLRPRLVVLASTYPRYAGDHEPSFVHELCRRLTDTFEVIAIVPHASGSQPSECLDGVHVIRYRYAPSVLETLVNNGGIVTNLRRNLWKWLLVPTFVVAQYLVALRYVRPGTIVHAHWLVPQGLLARALRAPYLVTCHGGDVFALRGKAAMVAKRMAARKASAVAVVSRAMQAPVAALGVHDIPFVMPMGVDLTGQFTPDQSVIRDQCSILFVGRLVEKKGVDVLIRAMQLIVDAMPWARLSIVGHGPLEASLRSLVKTLGLDGSILFVGPVSPADLPAWYRRATLFAAPFRTAASGDAEGLGLVTVEALGCGCPVVASDIEAARDVLDGMPGVLRVLPDDPEALATGILRVLEAPQQFESEAVAAVSLVRDRFDWEKVAAGYGRCLTDLGR